MADSIDYINSNDTLKNDPEVLNTYMSNLENFTPELLAKLIAMNGDYSFLVSRYIAKSVKDIEIVSQVLLNLDDSKKRFFLQVMGKYSPLMAPTEIVKTLGAMPGLTDEEVSGLGNGITSRLSSFEDQDSSIDLINRYYALLDEKYPRLINEIAPIAVQSMDLDESLNWLSNGAPAAVEKGDNTFVNKAIKMGDYEKPIELVNRLIESGQVPRSQKMIESYLWPYSAKNPEEAFKWIMEEIDPSLRTNQMMVTAFNSLYGENPEIARNLINSTTDPAVKAFYEERVRRAEKN